MFHNNEEYESKLTEEAIRNNFKIVAEMKPVKNIERNVLNDFQGKPDKQIIAYFDTQGKKVDSEFGCIGITKKSAKDITHHSLTKLKAYGIGAIKEVLEEGRVLYYNNNYKNTHKGRADMVAPIKISKGPYEGNYMMGVGIIVSLQSKRVTILELAIEKEPYEATIDNELPTHGSGSPSMLTLLQQVIDVKNGRISIDQVTAIGIDSGK